jgi:hypothetical protein
LGLRDEINAIINDPSARPTIEQGDHVLDCGELLARPGVVAFEDRGKALLFEPIGRRNYRAHVFCVAGERGAAALAYGAACCDRMFHEHEASGLEARAPRILPHVAIYATRLGFRRLDETADEIIFWKEAA